MKSWMAVAEEELHSKCYSMKRVVAIDKMLLVAAVAVAVAVAADHYTMDQ